MKILKHGISKKSKQVKFFICRECGCELKADSTEYKARPVEYNTTEYYIECPDCGNELCRYEMHWFKSNEK